MPDGPRDHQLTPNGKLRQTEAMIDELEQSGMLATDGEYALLTVLKTLCHELRQLDADMANARYTTRRGGL